MSEEDVRQIRVFFPHELLTNASLAILAAAAGGDLEDLRELSSVKEPGALFVELASSGQINTNDGAERLAGLLIALIRNILICSGAPKEPVLLNTAFIAATMADMAEGILKSDGKNFIETVSPKNGWTI